MKYFTLVVLASFLMIAGCTSKTTPGTATTNTNQAAPAAAPQAPTLGPKDVLKALNKASKEKDVAGIQKQLSQGTLAMLNETAQTEKRTVEDILTADGGAPFLILPEMREEKIDGDKATVEVMIAEEGVEIIPFVKENGEWKAALDLYVEDLKKRATEDMKAPPAKGKK